MRSRGSFRTTYAIVLVLEVLLSRRKELDHIVALLQERIDASIRYQIGVFRGRVVWQPVFSYHFLLREKREVDLWEEEFGEMLEGQWQ